MSLSERLIYATSLASELQSELEGAKSTLASELQSELEGAKSTLALTLNSQQYLEMQFKLLTILKRDVMLRRDATQKIRAIFPRESAGKNWELYLYELVDHGVLLGDLLRCIVSMQHRTHTDSTLYEQIQEETEIINQVLWYSEKIDDEFPLVNGKYDYTLWETRLAHENAHVREQLVWHEREYDKYKKYVDYNSRP